MNDDLIGLANLSQMYYNKGILCDKIGDFSNMIDAFNEASKFEHTQAMNRLGLYYDDNKKPELMLKYYLLAIDLGDTTAAYNLARYYFDIGEFINMKKYYLLGIKLGDTDSAYELALYYHDLKDYDNMKKYYIIATEMEIMNPIKNPLAINDGFKDFNPFTLISILESIKNQNSNIKTKIDQLSKNKEITIYFNKIRVAKKLNHTEECIICYETKLHINIYCGHCFCIDCYPSLFDKSCPLCRISKNSCAFI